MKYKVDFPIVRVHHVVLSVEAEAKDEAFAKACEVLDTWEKEILEGKFEPGQKLEFKPLAKYMAAAARLVRVEHNVDGWVVEDIKVEEVDPNGAP
jgi:hypothetical protein